jgi:NADH-quinone oxidoreductase subunit A
MTQAQFLHIMLFGVIGVAFCAGIMIASMLVRARGKDPLKETPYECGMEPVGTSWVSPNIRFYIFALLFLIFDVEALFIFPWAVQMRAFGFVGFIEILLFVFILLAGLIYAWKRDALKWE